MAWEQGGHLALLLRRTVFGSPPQGPALTEAPPSPRPRPHRGPALTEAAVDDSKAAAKGTHKGRGQGEAVLGFQDASWVWRLWELLIKGPWVRC